MLLKTPFILRNRILLILLMYVSLFWLTTAAAHESSYPQIIALPTGFQPEGIVTGRGHNAYVGSLASGAIYQVDLLSGHGHLFISGETGRAAVGLAYDQRRNYLFVAGGLNGNISVYNANNGKTIAEYQSDGDNTDVDPGFINDGIVTKRAAYFTDSFRPVIYKIPLSKSGRLMSKSQMETIPLSGDIEYFPGEFNANGIVANKRGDQLYINTTFTGQLFQLDPTSGVTTEVDMSGGDLANGDGMLLHDDTLYVVQNFINQISVVKLSESGTQGVIKKVITHPDFQIPTTAAKFGSALYVVNARFDVAPPPLPGFPPADPNTEFNLLRISIDDD